jgi:MerR family transcriptional regulator/heat shock protein HspR
MEERLTETAYRAETVCQLLRLSQATLRRYERHGLVRPRRAGRVSVYSEPELRRLRRIRRLTLDLGVNLAGVEVILRLLDRLERQGLALERGE